MIPLVRGRGGRFTETKGKTVVTRAWGEGRIESCCLTDTEFWFGMTKKSWEWIVVIIAQRVNECTILQLKMDKTVNVIFVY